MSRKKQDLIGNRYGMLTVTGEAPERAHNARYFYVKCDCGNTAEMHMSNLKKKWLSIKSCGCVGKHQGTGTRLHSIWQNMKQRCLNKNHNNYHLYGGKGITICPEWQKSFATFKTWAETHGYADDLSIDRKDGNKGYSPKNCWWTTAINQMRNAKHGKTYYSKYIGVCFFKRTGRWVAYINVNKKRVHLGYHDTALDAAIARDDYIRSHNLKHFIMNEV